MFSTFWAPSQAPVLESLSRSIFTFDLCTMCILFYNLSSLYALYWSAAPWSLTCWWSRSLRTSWPSGWWWRGDRPWSSAPGPCRPPAWRWPAISASCRALLRARLPLALFARAFLLRLLCALLPPALLRASLPPALFARVPSSRAPCTRAFFSRFWRARPTLALFAPTHTILGWLSLKHSHRSEKIKFLLLSSINVLVIVRLLFEVAEWIFRTLLLFRKRVCEGTVCWFISFLTLRTQKIILKDHQFMYEA